MEHGSDGNIVRGGGEDTLEEGPILGAGLVVESGGLGESECSGADMI